MAIRPNALHLVVTASLLVTPSQSVAGDVSHAYVQGVAHLKSGCFAQAMKSLDEAIRIDPKHTKSYRGRAFARLLAGFPKDAVEDFGVAIRIDTTDPVLYYGRGCTRYLLGDTGEALADLSEAIRVDPDYEEAYAVRSAINNERGAIMEGLSDMNELLRAANRNRSAPSFFADLAQRTDLTEGAHVNLDYFLVYRCWCIVYREHRERTVQMRTATRDKGPPTRSAGNPRESAIALAVQRRHGAAINCLDEAIRLDPKDWTIYRLRAAFEVLNGNPKSAITDMTRAIEIEPSDASLRRLRAQIYEEIGEKEKGRDDRLEVLTIRKRRNAAPGN